MRRLVTVLALLLVAAAMAAPVAADEVAGTDEFVLAVEQGEPQGPDPAPRDAEGNPAGGLGAYEELETPPTWAGAFLLMFAGVVGLVMGGGLYYLLVHRPARERENA